MWTILLPLFIATLVCAAPAPSQSSSASVAQSTVPYASDDPNPILWGPDTSSIPQAIRGSLGATILGPQDVSLDKQNPDLLAPPKDVMPMATGMYQSVHPQDYANKGSRLSHVRGKHASRSRGNSWAYILKNEGDLWYFPAGVPHSLQATDALPDGAEFLLVTDWMAHVPKEVLAKNFQADISAFDHIPGQELYIFPAGKSVLDDLAKHLNPVVYPSALPQPDSDTPISPQGNVPEPFTFKFSQVQPTQLSGGSVKVVDSTTFKIATGIAAAEVTINPGAMSEGTGRVTLFASSGNSRTYNYQAGDVGYVPPSYGHYVENTGNTTLRFLEIFNTDDNPWFKAHENHIREDTHDSSVSASSSFELLERGSLLNARQNATTIPYADGSTIDWQREEAAERERKRTLQAQRGLRGTIAPILDSSRIWIVIVLTGVGIGVAGAWLDVLVKW
ncbi:hypothetical protein PHLCEN_2v9932 [Hermanssonia centrifuga]|uniref:Cupin type-1 domain-containing protein n=1 Tax=Hermanssonia centrifuga TaxID=98765 RepID=A0A2R6NPC4_9APHY|nr:hypothetical protein PHLCEN_2v9932 [Hermanssonia centrifuga]